MNEIQYDNFSIGNVRYDAGMSFHELETAMNKLPYPVKPKKPVMVGNTPEAYREHAAKLEAHESDIKDWERDLQIHQNRMQMLVSWWSMNMRREWMMFNDDTFNIIMDMAWANGHSSGYGEVRGIFDDLATMADKIIKANKGA